MVPPPPKNTRTPQTPHLHTPHVALVSQAHQSEPVSQQMVWHMYYIHNISSTDIVDLQDSAHCAVTHPNIGNPAV